LTVGGGVGRCRTGSAEARSLSNDGAGMPTAVAVAGPAPGDEDSYVCFKRYRFFHHPCLCRAVAADPAGPETEGPMFEGIGLYKFSRTILDRSKVGIFVPMLREFNCMNSGN